ncbi:hypothetical protein APHAL10511_003511 [Amanita phalloides]|nr:hypothetical protein APHAL10511_003511 [Amanita phalloides]
MHHDKGIALGDPFVSEPASDESGDSQDHGADKDEDEKSTESETESDNAEGSGPKCNRSRACNTLLRECITWSDDEHQEGSHQELPMVIHGQIPYFDNIADDGVMMEDSPMPHQAWVTFCQVINTVLGLRCECSGHGLMNLSNKENIEPLSQQYSRGRPQSSSGLWQSYLFLSLHAPWWIKQLVK